MWMGRNPHGGAAIAHSATLLQRILMLLSGINRPIPPRRRCKTLPQERTADGSGLKPCVSGKMPMFASRPSMVLKEHFALQKPGTLHLLREPLSHRGTEDRRKSPGTYA